MASSKTTRMIVITNSAGEIIGAAPTGKSQQAGMNSAIAPLPGHQMHEVDVPENLTKLKSGEAFHHAISHARLNSKTGKIEFKPVDYKKVKH